MITNKKIKTENFSLKHTLESGQFFLYYLIDDFYYIINGENIFKVKQEKDILIYNYISQKDLIYFFSLDINYNKIYDDFSKDDVHLQNSLKKYHGLRIIRQDFWQCIISFVCSSCSNIPKIRKNLELISSFFGTEIILDGHKFHTFPKIGDLVDFDKLVLSKTGYRADYLYKINLFLIQNPHYLNEIKNSNYLVAKKLLIEFPGIGSKVADCICLFSLSHMQAFPVDTWVKQIIEKYYFLRPAKNIKEIEEFGIKNFGLNCGIKQQYLFHYFRNLKE